MPLPTAPSRRLPTVEMYHKKTGQTRIVNATVYALEYLCNPNWTTQSPKVSGYRPGNAADAQVAEDKREYELNKHRLDDPGEARKRGDRQRAYDKNTIVSHSPTLREAFKDGEAQAQETDEKTTAQESAPVPEQKVSPAPPEKVNWRKMPWFKCRAHVKKVTGTLPANKVQAEELMKGK